MKGLVWCGAMLALCAASIALAADDWQMWNTYAFKLPVIKKKVDLNGIFETRFRDDMDEFYRYHFYVGPDYYPWKWLTLGIQYGNIQQKPEGGDFETEHRIMYFVTPKAQLSDFCMKGARLWDFSLSVHNWLYYFIVLCSYEIYTWRYKLYPKLSYPVYKGEKFEIAPYAADAFYFPLEDGISFNDNRVYGGLGFKLCEWLGLDFYYMWRVTRPGRGGDWTGHDTVGTSVCYNF